MMHPLLYPMAAHVALSALLYVFLTIARAPAVWGIGRRPDGSNPWSTFEPRLSANLSNQFEWPLFFHIACLLMIVRPHGGAAVLAAAWLFVAGRVVHTVVQVFSTNVRLRGVVFTINFMSAMALWILLLMPAPQGEASKYLSDLMTTIQRSDRIEVSEHSNQYDFLDPDHPDRPIPKNLVYGLRVLDQEQKALFLTTIQGLDPATQNDFPACIFEPHHTVRFFDGERLLSTMQICFQCGQVEWDGTRYNQPWSLIKGLAVVIKGVGFHTEREWWKLAREHAG